MKDLQSISLYDIAPDSIRDDVNIYAIIEALDPELHLITSEIEQEYILSRIDEFDGQLLEALAWQFHADFYDLAPDLNKQREQVKESIKWHMKKGTAWAIVKALDMIGVDAEFINWPDYGGKPYCFKVNAVIRKDYYNYTDKDRIAENIYRVIMEAKAARSLLEKLDARIIDEAKARIYAGIAQGQTGNELINITRPDSPDNDTLIYANMQGLTGNELKNISRPDGSKDTIYHGQGEGKFRSISLGVELGQMQELLAQFEKRIYEAINSMEERIKLEINTRYSETDLKLDEIKNLLLWDEREADA